MLYIRNTAAGDAPALAEIQRAAFLPLYERYHDPGNPCLRGVDDISGRLENPVFRYFTILEGERTIGGVLWKCAGSTPFTAALEKGEYYLQRIYILPELQGRGSARRAILMCEARFSDARRLYVDFPEDLEKNRRCYASAGFQDSGKRLEVQPGLILAAYEKHLGA